LFQNTIFRRANAAAFFFGAGFMSIVIFLPLFLVNVLGVSATRAGMALVPFSMGLVFGSTFAGQVVSRIGHLRDQILAGGALLVVAVVLLARMDADVSYGYIMLLMVMCGLGFGPTLPLFTLAIQNAVDARRVGQATSAAQFFRQIGGTVGAAVMGTVLATTLGLAFASLDLPASVAEAPEAAPERLASTGGGELPDLIRVAYETRAISTEAAVAGGSAAEISEAAAEASRLRAEGHTEAERVTLGVRVAFTRATTRVYLLTVLLVVMAWLLTWRLPERPLRKTHDQDESAEVPATG
jgi:MFS family permease